VFTVDASGTGSLAVRPLPGVASVNAFAVTLEPAGGLPAPSGAMYLLGKS
jgi:anti-sigma-K factor RskA